MTTLLKFQASWCGPCKMLSRIMEDINFDELGVKVEEIDIEEKEDIAKAFNIRGVPTLALLADNGATLSTKVGMMQEEALVSWIKETVGR